MYFSSAGRNHHETEGGDAQYGLQQQATAQVHRGLVGDWRIILQETTGWKEKGKINFSLKILFTFFV